MTLQEASNFIRPHDATSCLHVFAAFEGSSDAAIDCDECEEGIELYSSVESEILSFIKEHSRCSPETRAADAAIEEAEFRADLKENP